MSFSVDAIQNLGLATVQPKKQALGQEQFLKLMTTQMTHQDPSKPMENGDFLAQMAQFSTVEGIGALNTSFQDFATSMTSKQALEASNLVGRHVAYPSDSGVLALDQPLQGSVNLDSAASDFKVMITDAAGNVVKTLNLGSQSAGSTHFSWDGALDDGSYALPGVYNVQAQANIDGQNTALQTLVSAKVQSVDLGDPQKGVVLNVEQLGSVPFSKVKQVF